MFLQHTSKLSFSREFQYLLSYDVSWVLYNDIKHFSFSSLSDILILHMQQNEKLSIVPSSFLFKIYEHTDRLYIWFSI